MGQTAKSTDPASHGIRCNCFRLLRQQCIQLNKSSSCLSTRHCSILPYVHYKRARPVRSVYWLDFELDVRGTTIRLSTGARQLFSKASRPALGTTPVSYSVRTGYLSAEVVQQGRWYHRSLHLVPRLRMNVVMPPLPTYLQVVHRDNLLLLYEYCNDRRAHV
jgi:hypothetical protein